MNIQPRYIVVEKIPGDTKFIASKEYTDNYQRCRVIQPPEGSIYRKGAELLVGHQICFDKASDFGDKAFYIDVTEVFGHIDGGKIIPSRDIVYIKADKHRKSKIKIGDAEFYNDTSYNPLAMNNIVQDGEVLTICSQAKHSVFEHDLEVEACPGDHVYTHHFLTDNDNEREFNGEKYYEIKYEELYCKVNNKKITMLNNWNFVVPVEKTAHITDSGIMESVKQENELRVGVIKHPNKNLPLKKEELVYFKKGREYKIKVEGDIYYRIRTEDIICKFNTMEALGPIVIVRPIKESNTVNGFVASINQNPIPEKGEVLATGDEVPSRLKKNNVVLFRKMASTEVEINGERVLLMDYKNIYAIV